MKKLHYIIISALLVGGCQSDPRLESEASPLVRTKVSELYYAQSDNIDLEELNIVSPSKFVKKGNLYAILTPNSAYRFAIYDSESGNVTRLVPAGKNEGEGMYYISMNLQGDIVSAFDFGSGRLVEIDLNEYATPGYRPVFTSLAEDGKTPFGAIRLDERILSTGLYTAGRYCISQATGYNSYSVSYPTCADPTLTDTLKSIFYASNILALNPMHSKVACANMQSGCLDICEIHDNELSRINEVHMTTPRVKFNRHRPKGRGLTHPVTYSRNNLFGFCDLAVSENYIFALYSGRTLKDYNLDVDKGKTIVVFDWNGLHVRTYQLQNACSAISYDAADNTIYALSQEGNKPQIITLNL